jgi:hypothetical protein
MFFVGYVLFEVPGAFIVERSNARKWMARILIIWVLITVLNDFIHAQRQFYWVRLLVGISCCPQLYFLSKRGAFRLGLSHTPRLRRSD